MLLLEKANQVQGLLRETSLACWMIFARETDIHPDPGMDLVVGTHVVRNSAFLFGEKGERIAITARFDVQGVRDGGVFSEVIGYDDDIRPQLLAALDRIAPGTIGLNYSTDDVTADGLTYGQWLLLGKLLAGTEHADRLVSAAGLLSRLRGRKTAGELDLIRQAIAHAEGLTADLTPHIRPGISEAALARIVHEGMTKRNVQPAWAPEGCPIVNCGPESEPGHSKPRADLVVRPGELVHVDLGCRVGGYNSDLQRMWYVLKPGETAAPAEVRRAYAVVVEAIEAALAALRPGVRGWEVDAVSRKVVVDAGYPEFLHGVGHGLGRAVHDGGTLLGPRWACYGQTVEGVVEEGNVFTLELGIMTSVGYVGLEEDVVVHRHGSEVMSNFPKEVVLV